MKTKLDALAAIINDLPPFAVAVSGGVDSMTMAMFSHDLHPDIVVFHATSPAVPPRATRRVQQYADTKGWRLHTIVAGEFEDGRYVSNPYNRCYFCKQNLYAEIRRHTDRPILSGANLDDLSDFRPGLKAAAEQEVRHPFVEARLRKTDVRALANRLGATTLAELPASPCLSSRIETSIEIDAVTLRSVDSVENWLTATFQARTVRCRVRKSGITVELDRTLLRNIGTVDKQSILDKVRETFGITGVEEIRFAEYRMGSAFLKEGQSA